MKKIENINMDNVFIKQYDYINDKAVGNISNDDETLYLIDLKEKSAYLLPDKYQKTPIIVYHQCGGIDDSGMIMVSLMGEIELQGFHDYSDVAGLWGWINIDGKEIIEPKYIYAMGFCDGYAIVCKGDWEVNDKGEYWCNNERWGVIDESENEVVPLEFDDEIRFVSDDKVAVKDGHVENGKWVDGTWKLYDIKTQKIIFTTEDSLRYSEYKDGYITIYNGSYYLYDFINDEYLFKDEELEDIYIIGRNKFEKEYKKD